MLKKSMSDLQRLSVEEFKNLEKKPIVIVLDNVRSALNVGSAFRTADAFALSHIYLCGITAQPPHREILKTAIGASRSVNWSHIKETKTAIQDLKKEGYIILTVEQTKDSVMLQDISISPDKKYALVFGNEVKGVEESLLPISDVCIEIPQFGTKHSLNVSVCLGIVSWEVVRNFF